MQLVIAFPTEELHRIQTEHIAPYTVKQHKQRVCRQYQQHPFPFYQLFKAVPCIFNGKAKQIIQQPVRCNKIAAVRHQANRLIPCQQGNQITKYDKQTDKQRPAYCSGNLLLLVPGLVNINSDYNHGQCQYGRQHYFHNITLHFLSIYVPIF